MAAERTVILSSDEVPVTDIPLLSLDDDNGNFDSASIEIPSVEEVQSAFPAKERSLYERVPLREAQVITSLEESVGIQTVAAKKLGVSLRQLRYAIKKFKLDIKVYKY